MNAEFTLYKSLIIETVKNETHIAAHITRASNKEAAEIAFHQEAGDESYHERKLERSLYASIDKVKAMIIGFLDTAGTVANITTTTNDDAIKFNMTLSDRFNAAYLTPLADLASKYVEDNMMVLWWTPIDPSRAKVYSEHVELDRQSIIQCFIKNAPASSSKTYQDVTGKKSDVQQTTA